MRPFPRSFACAFRVLPLALVMASGAALDAVAQDLQDPMVPAGRFRLGFAPSFAAWDSRYGLRSADGTVVEETESLGSDLTDPNGALLFPGVAVLRDQLRLLLDEPAYTPSIGAATGYVAHDITRLDFSGHLGVFDWLTVGATVPLVKPRTAVDVSFVSDAADLGVSPLLEQNAAVSAYLAELDAAAAAAEARAEALCGAVPPDEGCAAARDLADRTRAFATRTRAAYLASIFFPVQGTPAADALTAAGDELSAALEAAGLSPLGDPRFAGEVLDEEGFRRLPSNGGTGIGTASIQDLNPDWTLGDVEVSAAVRILDGERRDSGAAVPRMRWTMSGGVLVRLGTGSSQNPEILLDVGTGDGQTDIEGFVHGGLDLGRLGVRAEARYGVQSPTTLVRRVAPPEQIFAGRAVERAVEWSPGAYLDLAFSPRFRLTDGLALALDYRLYRKAADGYELLQVTNDGDDPDPAVLVAESERTLGQIGFGIRYSTVPAWRRGTAAPPIEVTARVVRSVHGRGGQTPREARADLAIRLFPRIWGR